MNGCWSSSVAMNRHRLSLKEKIELIQLREKEKLTVRALVEHFNISKSHVKNILRDKNYILKLWKEEVNSNSPSDVNRKIDQCNSMMSKIQVNNHHQGIPKEDKFQPIVSEYPCNDDSLNEKLAQCNSLIHQIQAIDSQQANRYEDNSFRGKYHSLLRRNQSTSKEDQRNVETSAEETYESDSSMSESGSSLSQEENSEEETDEEEDNTSSLSQEQESMSEEEEEDSTSDLSQEEASISEEDTASDLSQEEDEYLQSKMESNPYIAYFHNQVGGSLDMFREPIIQRGYGVGSIFKSQFNNPISIPCDGLGSLVKEASSKRLKTASRNLIQQVANRYNQEGQGRKRQPALKRRKTNHYDHFNCYNQHSQPW